MKVSTWLMQPGAFQPRVLLPRLLLSLAAVLLVVMHWTSGITHVVPVRFDRPVPGPMQQTSAVPASPSVPVQVPVQAPLQGTLQASLQVTMPSSTLHSPTATPAPQLPTAPIYREQFASRGDTAQVHASTAYVHREGGLTAFWYGGSREGARDVSIYSSRLSGGEWDVPRLVIDRKRLKHELNRHIRKVGNATVYQHPDGRLWLFFVTVSVGGWAGSSVNLVESDDDGKSWSPARRLVTSPLLNLSTLVRSSALRYEDGSIGLPVYHEFIGKFAELLRIAPDGRILRKTRFTSGRHALQPEIAVISPDRAVGLLRYAGDAPRRLLYMSTDNAGRTWTEPIKLPVPNPDAAIDVVALGGDRLLAVMNDLDEGRNRLVLAASDNLGRDWRTVQVLDYREQAPGSNETEFSYPWLVRSAAGEFHVLYTWNRTRIKHVEFNQHWLNSRRPNEPR